jgi:hypothetical protein
MGLYIKLLLAILILGLAGLFVLKKPDGTPILSFDELVPDVSALIYRAQALIATVKNIETLKAQVTAESEVGHQKNNTRSDIYRWKDRSGQWQFADTPPSDVAAETIDISGNLNRDLVAAYQLRKESNELPKNHDGSSSGLSPMTVSPDKIPTLIEDANKIQKLMDDRSSTLEKY